ncbi:MAG TPA: hypothetical protein DHM37_01150, partial [Candidatus Cloacimonas sp.]|nr:hypothetical protein [Candidatus Cloacimonas sp.]
GQAYANYKSITTYIFPLIEIGLWYGMYHFQQEGEDKEAAYKKWATEEIIGYDEINNPIYRYSRDRQDHAKDDLIIASNNPFYVDHFRLDDENSQHFYEDIGKYNKYIFGWQDWFDIYCTSPQGYATNANWIWEDESADYKKWAGNQPINPNSQYYVGKEQIYDNHNGIYSEMRAEYIDMRREAEDYYDKADLMSFGIVFNHIISAFDALRVTKQYNFEAISQNNLKMKISPMFVDNQVSLGLVFSKGF